jgi:hypothetical protein
VRRASVWATERLHRPHEQKSACRALLVRHPAVRRAARPPCKATGRRLDTSRLCALLLVRVCSCCPAVGGVGSRGRAGGARHEAPRAPRSPHGARCRAGRTPVPLSSASSPSHHITPSPRPRSTSSSQQRLLLIRTRSRNAGPHPGCAAEPAMAAPAPEPTLLEAAEQEAPVSREARGAAQQGVE